MIPLFKVFMSPTVMQPIKKVLQSGYIGQGPKVKEFEDQLKIYIGCNSLVTTNTGTSALHLALRLINIKRGDNVITTSLTFWAAPWTILLNGADIKWADVGLESCNTRVKDIESKIDANTKAIIVMHWGGYPCDMDEINQLGRQYNIPIIEDAAQAFGSTYKGKKVGSLGNYTVFSFQATKVLTTVDGGCLVVPREERRAKLLRWYGVDKDRKTGSDFRQVEDIKEIGDKLHMNDLTATIGLEHMGYFQKNIILQRENAAFYNKNLNKVPGVTLTQQRTDRESTYWVYTIRVDKREDLIRKLTERNISASCVHPRNDTHSCVCKYRAELPNTDILANEILCIPVGWWVKPKDREYIAETIKEGW